MTPSGTHRVGYDSPEAFRRAVATRLQAEARRRARPPQQLRREFLFQRFLARVFRIETSPWVLKGGTAMVMRMPGARYSQDVDLLRATDHLDVVWAIADLRAAVDVDLGDHLRFVIDDPIRDVDGQTTARIRASGYTGATLFDRFTVDLSTRPQLIGDIDVIRPDPVIEVPGMAAMPGISVYPLPDQVADKICAMYDVYGAAGGPSTRYRDLVDLVLITSREPLDGRLARLALRSEEARRGIVIPDPLRVPGPQWAAGYRKIARDARLPAKLHDVEEGLAAVALCLGPLLTGEVASGTWDPQGATWR